MQKKYKNLVILAILAAVIYTVLVITTYVLNFSGGLSNEHSDWGVFGDYIGGLLNPFFGLLSLILLTQTIRIQIQQSRIQADTAKLNHEAFNQQLSKMEEQSHSYTFESLLEDLKKQQNFKNPE